MSRAQKDRPSTQATIDRAEELVNRFGAQLGYLTARAAQRVQTATSAIRAEADRMDLPKVPLKARGNGNAGARKNATGRPNSEKAEEMVDQLGHRLSQYTARTGLQLQKLAARTREEAEDIWAEAQNLRQRSRRSS